MKNTKNLIEDLNNYFNGTAELPDVSEYNLSDEAVRLFFAAMESDNVRLAMKDIRNDKELSETLIKDLYEIAESESLAILRYAYHNLQKATGVENEATLIEDLDLDIEDLTKDEHRYEAASALQKFAEFKPELKSITDDIVNLVLEGSNNNIKTAARLVKTVYTGAAPESNIKLAYTSLVTQNNEPYQMCPKAARQLGYAVPMEISKCVNNCIDSRKSLDGTVSCAYQDWSKLVQDNQAAVLARLANSRFNDNKSVKLLNDITRPGRDEVERSFEYWRENSKDYQNQEDKYKFTDLRTQSTEKALSDRKLNTQYDDPDKTQQFSKQTADANGPHAFYEKKANNSEKRIVTASIEDNNIPAGETMKKFNLANYISANSINDKLDQARDFFDDYGYENPMSMNKDNGANEPYESATSMEDLISDKHTGEAGSTTVWEEKLESRRIDSDKEIAMKPINSRLESHRKNDPDEQYLKTMEERLREHKTGVYTKPLKNQSPPAKPNNGK